MNIELTAVQRAKLINDLIEESSTEEMEKLTLKVVRAYATFRGADMIKVQAVVASLMKKSEVASPGESDDSEF
jgi:hypothetical protein